MIDPGDRPMKTFLADFSDFVCHESCDTMFATYKQKYAEESYTIIEFFCTY